MAAKGKGRRHSAESTFERFISTASSGHDVERTTFFSDAVFAISMTLLAIEIVVPETEDAKLASAVLRQWPQFAAYALSFAVIGAYWLTHHRLFRLLDRYDVWLQRINLLALLFLGLVSYGTALLVEYGNHAPAVIVYAIAIASVGLVQAGMWRYARVAGLFGPNLDRPLYQYMRNRSLVVPCVFIASIPVALWSPDAAKYFWLLIIVVDALLAVRARRDHRAPAPLNAS